MIDRIRLAPPWVQAVWTQMSAAIDMLENAIAAIPDDQWDDENQSWYLAYHTLFWLDCYLSVDPDQFTPPAPFTLAEADPAGVIPPRTYTRTELLDYVPHCRAKCRDTLSTLDERTASELISYGSLRLTRIELHLYNLRHVQHGAAQLNLILRTKTRSAPPWVSRGRDAEASE